MSFADTSDGLNFTPGPAGEVGRRAARHIDGDEARVIARQR